MRSAEQSNIESISVISWYSYTFFEAFIWTPLSPHGNINERPSRSEKEWSKTR